MSDKKKVQGDYEGARSSRKGTEHSVQQQKHGDKLTKGDPVKASAKMSASGRDGQAHTRKPGLDKNR